MCIDIDGYHSGGSSFVHVSVIKIKIIKIKKEQVKSPSLYSLAPRTQFGFANRVGLGIGV